MNNIRALRKELQDIEVQQSMAEEKLRKAKNSRKEAQQKLELAKVKLATAVEKVQRVLALYAEDQADDADVKATRSEAKKLREEITEMEELADVFAPVETRLRKELDGMNGIRQKADRTRTLLWREVAESIEAECRRAIGKDILRFVAARQLSGDTLFEDGRDLIHAAFFNATTGHPHGVPSGKEMEEAKNSLIREFLG